MGRHLLFFFMIFMIKKNPYFLDQNRISRTNDLFGERIRIIFAHLTVHERTDTVSALLVKKSFYELRSDTMRKLKRGDIRIVMDDVNSKG